MPNSRTVRTFFCMVAVGSFVSQVKAEYVCPSNQSLSYSKSNLILGNRSFYIIPYSGDPDQINMHKTLRNLVYNRNINFTTPDIVCVLKTAKWDAWTNINNPSLNPRFYGTKQQDYYECLDRKSGVKYPNPVDIDCSINCARESGGNPAGTYYDTSIKRETGMMYPAHDGNKLVDKTGKLFNIYTGDYASNYKERLTIVNCDWTIPSRRQFVLRPLYWLSTDREKFSYTGNLLLTVTHYVISKFKKSEQFNGL
ncbi:hypothetical protein SynPROS71_50018 [Synechococcus sp. PROS-7-1]|nr:hypothetical protein SynPROS71_50018 [Synechococcus sp. PROS-7-1]